MSEEEVPLTEGREGIAEGGEKGGKAEKEVVDEAANDGDDITYWTDDEFTPSDERFGQSLINSGLLNDVKWLRPHEFTGVVSPNGDGASIFKGDIEAGDARQGAISDCWLISALASCCEYPQLIRYVGVKHHFIL